MELMAHIDPKGSLPIMLVAPMMKDGTKQIAEMKASLLKALSEC
jgi:hypothetical protein